MSICGCAARHLSASSGYQQVVRVLVLQNEMAFSSLGLECDVRDDWRQVVINASREFCYRWVCNKCGSTHREANIQAGDLVTCVNCKHEDRCVSITYDNGCIVRSSVTYPESGGEK